MWGDRLLPATAAATYVLMLLGIYTAAVGAGLTCGARWPLCDGAVFGLFPANWVSFVEWFHRLVALVTGFLILGSWFVTWRSSGNRRGTWAFTAAVVLTPVQIWLGAETVRQYEVLILSAHFVTAMLIFIAVLAGVWWSRAPAPSARRRSRLLGGAAALTVPFLALTPQLFVAHTGPVQVIYYGTGLAIAGAVLLAALDALSAAAPTRAFLAAGALVLVGVRLTAGRLVRSPTIHTVDWLAAIGLVVVLAVALTLSTGILGRPIRAAS